MWKQNESAPKADPATSAFSAVSRLCANSMKERQNSNAPSLPAQRRKSFTMCWIKIIRPTVKSPTNKFSCRCFAVKTVSPSFECIS